MKEDLQTLTKELEQEYRRWDHLRVNGGSDPSWSDGVNLNLIRNHIISYKHQIQELVAGENSEMTLFKESYPDIWYKELPPEMPDDFMAKASEIRERAKEQFKLYQADPNFQYLKEHAREAFPRGETRETRAAGLPYYGALGLGRYEKDIEQDDLVAMRRDFYESYEPRAARWAEYAGKIRAYLEGEIAKSPETSPSVDPDFEEGGEDEEDQDFGEEEIKMGTPPSEGTKLSFDSVLKDVIFRAEGQKKDTSLKHSLKQKEEQLSLF